MQAPHSLSSSLLGDLDRLAAIKGGKVRLHGHDFALWMHRAFPRECPLPQELGKMRPRMPETRIRSTERDNPLSDEDAVAVTFLFALLYILALVAHIHIF